MKKSESSEDIIKYHQALKRILSDKGGNIIGKFSCKGFDRTGPWVAINGIRIAIREVVNDKLQQAYKQENRRETGY